MPAERGAPCRPLSPRWQNGCARLGAAGCAASEPGCAPAAVSGVGVLRGRDGLGYGSLVGGWPPSLINRLLISFTFTDVFELPLSPEDFKTVSLESAVRSCSPY